MKFLSAIILTALLSYVSGLYFPWWSIAFAAFLVAVAIPQKPFHAFLAGFLALFLLWIGLALWIDMNNKHLLSLKIAEILFKTPSHALILSATGLVGALVAGFAALTGNYVRKKPSE